MGTAIILVMILCGTIFPNVAVATIWIVAYKYMKAQQEKSKDVLRYAFMTTIVAYAFGAGVLYFITTLFLS